jgi:hypothetical protein
MRGSGRIDKAQRKKERKVFFSEEKKQKTFIFWRCGNIPAMASIMEAAEEQKSFGSFLQKRTSLESPLPAGVAPHCNQRSSSSPAPTASATWRLP